MNKTTGTTNHLIEQDEFHQVTSGVSTGTANTQIQDNFRVRHHRYSALPVKDILKIRMKDLGISNPDMQKALGYPMPNVISMMKTGTMRLPASKAVITAKLLQLDPVFFLGKVISENDPALWDVISEVMTQHLITANELALINFARAGLDGHDVNLVTTPAFNTLMATEFAATVERENALALAALAREDD